MSSNTTLVHGVPVTVVHVHVGMVTRTPTAIAREVVAVGEAVAVAVAVAVAWDPTVSPLPPMVPLGGPMGKELGGRATTLTANDK